MGLVSLEVVIIGVELDQEAVRQDGHARDDAENRVPHGLLDQKAVGNVGGIGKVQLQTGWVDECDLCSPNLVIISVLVLTV
jgi:hypothetical protein